MCSYYSPGKIFHTFNFHCSCSQWKFLTAKNSQSRVIHTMSIALVHLMLLAAALTSKYILQVHRIINTGLRLSQGMVLKASEELSFP